MIRERNGGTDNPAKKQAWMERLHALLSAAQRLTRHHKEEKQ